MTYVLDAFALLAHFKSEPGALRMEALFDEGSQTEELVVSAANLGEVVYKTIRQFGLQRGQEVLSDVRQLPVTVLGIDQQLALDAAYIKAIHPISYADCIAAALAQRLDATLVTGGKGFRQVADLKIEWLPR